MSKKSEKQEENKENKNHTSDCKIEISLLEYKIKVSEIKCNFIERKYRLDASSPELSLLN